MSWIIVLLFISTASAGIPSSSTCTMCIRVENHNLTESVFQRIKSSIERCRQVDKAEETQDTIRKVERKGYEVIFETTCPPRTDPITETTLPQPHNDEPIGLTAGLGGTGGILIIGAMVYCFFRAKCCRVGRRQRRDPFEGDVTLEHGDINMETNSVAPVRLFPSDSEED